MKFLILGLLLSANIYAQDSKLTEIGTNSKVVWAIYNNYELGRHEADNGGISELKAFSNDQNLSVKEIVREVMFNLEITEDITKISCSRFNSEDCLESTLKGNVQANYQFTSLMDFIKDMKNWWDQNDQDQWHENLEIIENFVLSSVGSKPIEIAYGYDYVADVFVIITISQDLKTVIVSTGDFGA